MPEPQDHAAATRAHRYERAPGGIGPDDSLERLAAWLAPGSTVLELGPASGYFTRRLREELGCTVDAVELDPAMAELARPWCRRLVVGDLARLDLDAALAGARYEAIVVADVIEHVVDADAVLARLKALLAPGGTLLLSVPNVAYAGLVAALLEGRFEYRDEGLLDRSHLRFFTRDSLAALLARNGLHAHAWAAVFRPLLESEFKLRLETLPAALREALLAGPWALCYQWLVRAGLEPPAVPPAEPPPCRADAFPLRVFYRNVDERDDSDREAVAWGEVGCEAQRLRVTLPEALARSHIRLNLADRSGCVQLRDVRIVADETVLWRWQPGAGLAALAALHDGLALAETPDCALAELHGAQSWLLLATAELAVPAGAVLEMDVGWPWSTDFAAAAAAMARAAAPADEALPATEPGAEAPPLEPAAEPPRGWLARLARHVFRAPPP